MALRKAHGNGADALVRVETLPADELPTGVPGPKPDGEAFDRPPYARGSAAARRAGSKGGKAKAGQPRLTRIGASALESDPRFEPYRRQAIGFRKAQCSHLALTVGGGYCGPGPASMVASAALALAASRFLYAYANGDPAVLVQAARLADSSRTALLTATELCAREAQARAAVAPPVDIGAALRAGLPAAFKGGK